MANEKSKSITGPVASITRGLFLTAGTFLVVGCIVEIICFIIVVLPFINENQFHAARCSYLSSSYGTPQSCQDLLNRKPIYQFLCLQVSVDFNSTSLGAAGSANLFLYYSYYSSSDTCTSRICFRDSTLNERQFSNLNATFYNANRPFDCYVRTDWGRSGQYVAVYDKEIGQHKVFHCVLWPLLAAGVGGLVTWSLYCAAGCGVWGSAISV